VASNKLLLQRLKQHNQQELIRLEDELAKNQRRLHDMQLEHLSQRLRLGDAAQRELAIEGLLKIKGSRAVNILAKQLSSENDARLREKILDAIEACIELKPVSDSFTQMRAQEQPIDVLAIYATDIANNYTHALAA